MNSPNDCGLKQLYLYYFAEGPYFNYWYIGEEVGDARYYAKCTTPKIENPVDCGRNWLVANESDVDMTVEMLIAPCPEINCIAGVKFEYIDLSNDVNDPDNYDDSCIGEFHSLVFHNQFNYQFPQNIFFKNTRYVSKTELILLDYTIYLYFDEKDFRWICSNEFNVSQCYSYYGIQADREWFQLNETKLDQNITWFNGKILKNAMVTCLSEYTYENITTNYNTSIYTPQPTSTSYIVVTPSPTMPMTTTGSINTSFITTSFITTEGSINTSFITTEGSITTAGFITTASKDSGSNSNSSSKYWWAWVLVAIFFVVSIVCFAHHCQKKYKKSPTTQETQTLLDRDTYHQL